MTYDQALNLLIKDAGTKYDAMVVDACSEVIKHDKFEFKCMVNHNSA